MYYYRAKVKYTTDEMDNGFSVDIDILHMEGNICVQ